MTHTSAPAYFPKTRVDKKLRRIHGVVEAAHYDEHGQLQWVRVHLRRFDAFADHQLLAREELINRLKSGQRFVMGKRDPWLGNTFEIGPAIQLSEKNGQPFLTLEGRSPGEQELEGMPRL